MSCGFFFWELQEMWANLLVKFFLLVFFFRASILPIYLIYTKKLFLFTLGCTLSFDGNSKYGFFGMCSIEQNMSGRCGCYFGKKFSRTFGGKGNKEWWLQFPFLLLVLLLNSQMAAAKHLIYKAADTCECRTHRERGERIL